MAKVLGFGGVFFRSHDPKKLADWYANWLGLEINPAFGGAIFSPSSLPEKAYAVWSPFAEDSDCFDPSKREFMINLIVDDLAGTLQQVAMGGASLVGDPKDMEYWIFGWFIDSEGTKVELWQPK